MFLWDSENWHFDNSSMMEFFRVKACLVTVEKSGRNPLIWGLLTASETGTSHSHWQFVQLRISYWYQWVSLTEKNWYLCIDMQRWETWNPMKGVWSIWGCHLHWEYVGLYLSGFTISIYGCQWNSNFPLASLGWKTEHATCKNWLCTVHIILNLPFISNEP